MLRARLLFGILIASPVTLVTGLFYVLPFWLFGWHRYLGMRVSTSELSPLGVGLVWVVHDARAPKWLLKRWEGWGGHCVGSLLVLRKDPSELEPRGKVLLNHELHHVHQVHKLGALQPLLYTLSSLTAWLSGERAYSANQFEVAARRAAGQIADAQSFTQGYSWCRISGGNKK